MIKKKKKLISNKSRTDLYRICIRWGTVSPGIGWQGLAPISNKSEQTWLSHWAHKVLMNIKPARPPYLLLYSIAQTRFSLYCLDVKIQTPSWGSRAQTLHFLFIWCEACSSSSIPFIFQHEKWDYQKRALSALPSNSIYSWLARNK